MGQRYYRTVVKGDFLEEENDKKVSSRLGELGELIRFHNDLYHGQGAPEILSDVMEAGAKFNLSAICSMTVLASLE